MTNQSRGVALNQSYGLAKYECSTWIGHPQQELSYPLYLFIRYRLILVAFLCNHTSGQPQEVKGGGGGGRGKLTSKGPWDWHWAHMDGAVSFSVFW